MPVRKKRKKSAKTIAKDEAWMWFSRLRRTECCFEQTGTLTNGWCVTCGKKLAIKNLQCGHASGSRSDGLLFYKHATSNQCFRCNIALNGQYDLYSLYIIDKYGLDEWRKIVSLKDVKDIYTQKDFEQLAKKFEREYYDFCKHPYIVE